MLAQVFLTARKLGLKAKEREALLQVLEGLERGWFVHTFSGAELGYEVGLGFNMGEFYCGTTACIAGWADVLYGTRFSWREWTDHKGRPKNLQDLFLGTGSYRCLERISTAQAARALRNYLTTGKPYWADVIDELPMAPPRSP